MGKLINTDDIIDLLKVNGDLYFKNDLEALKFVSALNSIRPVEYDEGLIDKLKQDINDKASIIESLEQDIKDIFKWFDENAVNLNFSTRNIGVDYLDYFKFKDKYIKKA